IYHWMMTPRTAEDFSYENFRIYDVALVAPGYDAEYRVDASLPKVERDQAIVKFVDEHPLKKHKYTLDLVNPKTGKPYEIESRSVLTAADLETIKKGLAPDCTKGDFFDKLACEGKGRIVGGAVPEWDLPDIILNSPKMGLTQISEFLDGDYLGDDNRKLLQGIQANGFLTLKKGRSLGMSPPLQHLRLSITRSSLSIHCSCSCDQSSGRYAKSE